MAVKNLSWIKYAEQLRKRMFREQMSEITLPVEEVEQNSGADAAVCDLRSSRFWTGVQGGKMVSDALRRNGIEVDFDVKDDGRVHELTFSLDETWRGIQERALLREIPAPGSVRPGSG